jgi:integrase
MSDRTGIYRHGAGWRAVVSQGRGHPRLTRHFPLETPLRDMQEWRKDAKAESRVARKARASAGTFEADAKRYLKAIAALPTFTERARHIELWIDAFGVRRRDSIRPAEIRAIRDRWLTEPRQSADHAQPLGQPLAAGTVNKRLRALSNLWRVLDGKQAYNPVRDVDEAREPQPIPRALDYQTIEAIIGQMRETQGGQWKRPTPFGWAPKAGLVSLAKIRVRILAYTGLSPSTLMRLKPADVDLARRLVCLPARRKGRGVAGTVVPLLPPAAEAFQQLAARKAFGPFNLRSVRYAFTRAAARAKVSGVRLQDLRHSLATIAYELTGSLDVVMALLQHASPATTKRYVLAARLKVLQQQTAPLVQRFGTTGQADNSR